MNSIESYLNALQTGMYTEGIVMQTIKRLNNCSLEEYSNNRILMSRTFYELLKACQSLYDSVFSTNITESLLVLFDNIRRIATEASEDEKKDSSVIIIEFLHRLKVYEESGDIGVLEDMWLQSHIEILLEQLEEIEFVFRIRREEKDIFPISKMVVKVIEKPEFLSPSKPLSEYHVHILQLAVKLFQYQADENKVLKYLVEDCNLHFINYLREQAYLVDTKKLTNYQHNGVMIFFNRENNKVLIRHEDEKYFNQDKLPEGCSVEEEYDYSKNTVIGRFIEYKISEGDSLIDFSKALENEAGRQKILQLVFDKGMYNILIEDSLIRKENGDFQAINPFCSNDDKIIKGKKCDQIGKVYDKEQLLEALDKYRNCAIKSSAKYIMNRVSLGMCIQLLSKYNTGTEVLSLDELLEDDWYQMQVIKKWINSNNDKYEAIFWVIGLWYQQIEYCMRRKKNSNNVVNIEEHEICPQDFYPIELNTGWMMSVLGYSDEWYVLSSRIQEDDEQIILKTDLSETSEGNRLKSLIHKDYFQIDIEDVKDEEKIFNDTWINGNTVYFLYNSQLSYGVILNQTLLKLYVESAKLSKNCMQFGLCERITKEYYDSVADGMNLHEDALKQVGKHIFSDLDTQIYYRLIHNLLWSNVQEETVKDYFTIIMHHQLLEFKDVDRDEKFVRGDPHILYVPKDKFLADSVVANVYYTYLKEHTSRDGNSLFNDRIDINENGQYCRNGQVITKIIFLCDNIEKGKSTIRMLSAYLGILSKDITEEEHTKIEDFKRNIQNYMLRDSSVVSMMDIISRNHCLVEVHSFYGTDEGAKKVDEFLQENNIRCECTTYEREILKEANTIKEEVKKYGLNRGVEIFILLSESLI